MVIGDQVRECFKSFPIGEYNSLLHKPYPPRWVLPM